MSTEKRDHPEDEVEGGPSVPKKVKSYGYSLSAKLWVLTNYEYCDGDEFVPKSEIMSHFENEKESINKDGKPVNLAHSSLGRIIHDVWKGKVLSVKKSKDGKRSVVLKNLRRKISRPSNQPVQHGNMNLINIPGWELRINNELSLSLIRVENWLLDDQRVVTEIRTGPGGDEDCNLSLQSHGCRVNSGEIGLHFGHVSDLSEKLQMIADFMSTCHLCQGFEVCESITREFLPNRVALYSLAAEPDQQESRVFSKKCQIISPPGWACLNCSKLKRSETQKRQRSEARSGNISTYHNDRYLTKEELFAKLETMKKAQQNARDREQRLKKIIELAKLKVNDC